MKLHLSEGKGRYQIQGYHHQGVTINEKIYNHNLIVTPTYLAQWEVDDFAALHTSHFESLIALQPELVLLGTGKQLRFPDQHLFLPLLTQQIGVEVMDTQAACRTYAILMAEDRQVLAALLLDN